ncbi:hypothetical protein MUZ84_004871 [Salmonella enterica]|nr:hypothetical protein [Salmonella enterica]
MMLFGEGYQELAHNVVGKKLQNINGLIYVYDVPDLEAPQQLQFVFFSENQSIVFRCGQDGASLELIDSPMQENNLGEYGKEEIMDLLRIMRSVILRRHSLKARRWSRRPVSTLRLKTSVIRRQTAAE